MAQEKDLQPNESTRQRKVEGQGVLKGIEPATFSIREGETVVIPLTFLARREAEISLK